MSDIVSFSHSGNLGDIIYSLPSIKAYCTQYKVKAHIVLTYNKIALYQSFEHPFGSFMLTETACNYLKPLLLLQPYIDSVTIQHIDEPLTVDFNLDEMRELGDSMIDLRTGNIPEWYFMYMRLMGHDLSYNLQEPYLTIFPYKLLDIQGNYITVARSGRYRNDDIDYSALKIFGRKVMFLGLPGEYEDFVKVCTHAVHCGTDTASANLFCAIAYILSHSVMLFANQTFIYSLAEAMKAPRSLEVSPLCPNVRAIGHGSHEVRSQEQFDMLVDAVYTKHF